MVTNVNLRSQKIQLDFPNIEMKRIIYLLLGIGLLSCTEPSPSHWVQTSGPVYWKENNAFKGTVNCIVANDSFIFTGSESGIYRSDLNGQSWVPINKGIYNQHSVIEVSKIAVLNKYIFAGTWGSPGGIYRSADNGLNWQPVFYRKNDNTYVNSLFTDGSNLYAQISGNSMHKCLYISTDMGSSWKKTKTSLTSFYILIGLPHEKEIYAGTISGIIVSSDNGINWTAIDTSYMISNKHVQSIIFVDSVLIAGTNDGVFLSNNYGKSWKEIPNGIENLSINSLVAIDKNLFAATDEGVYCSNNLGLSWTLYNEGIEGLDVQKLAIAGQNLIAGTSEGMYLSSDNGKHWRAINYGLGNTFVYSLATMGKKLYAGTNGGVFLSTDYGKNWRKFESIFETEVRSLAISGNNLIAGTDYGVIYYTEKDTGSTLLTSSKGNGMNNLTNSLAVFNSKIFAGTFGSGVFRSSNNGKTWVAVNNGLVDSVISSLAVNGKSLYAGTNGGVYLSDNYGNSWTRIFSENYVQSIAITKGDLYVTTRGNGIFVSQNKGMNWTALNTGIDKKTIIETLHVIGNDLYAGSHNGVYILNKSKKTWVHVNIGLGVSSSPVNSITNIGNRIFAGTNGYGVYTSTINE